ncbi:MAG: NIPSNAP family protein [Sedimentisphaerales bacterium]|nr:NIPSNAP family protein [Sedimentisphaerales bacterium]
MDRRNFIAASSFAAGGIMASQSLAAENVSYANKQFLELRHYQVADEAQQKLLGAFLRDVAIPAMNRIGIKPIGAFIPLEDANDLAITLLMPHPSLESVVTCTSKLLADELFMKDGKAFLELSSKDKGYERIESSLLLSFDAVPKVEVPKRIPERVFQLRCYESHSILAGQKKIEMFNTGGEIDIFRRTGLPPVFFGQMIIGKNVPNLTYMVGFENIEAQKEGWKKFVADPAWETLKNDPRYADTVSKIHNILLRPLPCSQL